MSKKEILVIFLAALFFSTMEVFLKMGGEDFDPFQLTFLRFVIGGVFLLPFALVQMRKKGTRLTPGDLGYLLFLGVLCVCISMVLFQLAVMEANAGLVAVIICSNPVFISIFAHFLLGERFNKRKALVLLISLAGLVFLANPFHLSQGNSILGILFALASSVVFSLYSAVGKFRIARIGDLAQTSLSFLFGSTVLLLFLAAMEKPVLAGISLHNAPLLLYAGIGVTGIGYYLYFMAIHISGASNAGLVFFLKPLFAPLIALLILGESITWNMAVGIALILFGSLISIRGSRKDGQEVERKAKENEDEDKDEEGHESCVTANRP